MRITSITPAYNAAQDLTGAIQSVREQGHDDIEMVIVDDGSRDETLEIAWALAADDPRVSVQTQPNQGPAAARNAGLRAATGDLVCFLDADDRYAPGFFGSALEIMARLPRCMAVECAVELLDCPFDLTDRQREAVHRSLPGNLILRRAAVELLGGFPVAEAFRGEAAGEDSVFCLALKRWFHVERVTTPFFRHQVRAGGHLERFLERSREEDGRLVFEQKTEEEESGAISAATRAYLRDIETRMQAARFNKRQPQTAQPQGKPRSDKPKSGPRITLRS